MNQKAYQKYLQKFFDEALANSDGTTSGAANYLRNHLSLVKVTIFTPNPTEKSKAYTDALRAFDSGLSLSQVLDLLKKKQLS